MSKDDLLFSVEEIRAVYWKEFHEAGVLWFCYLGDAEENTASTEYQWQLFLRGLRALRALDEKTCVIADDGRCKLCGKPATHVLKPRINVGQKTEHYSVTHVFKGNSITTALCDEHAEEQRELHISCGCAIEKLS